MQRNKKWILAVIPCVVILMTTNSYAQSFYKWTDEQGATHYTQTPPPEKFIKKIAISTHVPEDSAKEIKSLKDQSSQNLKVADAGEKQADQDKVKAAAEAERRNKNSKLCEQLKNNQALLQTGQRIHTADAKGERSYLTEEQKAAQIKQQATQIKNDCPQ